MISDRHGELEKSSNGGNGMCRKKPIITSGRRRRSIAGTSCRLVVVDPHGGVRRSDVGQLAAKRSLTAT